MNTNSILYSLKVWLTSVGLAPVMYLIIDSCQRENYYSTFTGFINHLIGSYAICVIFGGLFSFVTWVLFFLIIRVITLFYPLVQPIKYIIVTIGVLLTVGTFALALPESFDVYDDFFYLMISNCICIAAGSLFYKLEIKDEANVIVN